MTTRQTPRTALITGASRGIGAAVARRLARDGDGIIVHYLRSSQEAEEVASACLKLGAAFAVTASADMRAGSSVSELKESLLRQGLSPDIVVHNAGTAHYGLVEDTTAEEWDDIQHLHLRAAYLLAKHFGREMAWRRTGRFVHVSSVWGVVGGAGEAAYSAAKGGLNAFTKALAQEMGHSGVTVNAVAPGIVETDMLKALTKEEQDELLLQMPLGRFATPEEVADLIHFLASDEASYVTGQIIGLTGGWRL